MPPMSTFPSILRLLRWPQDYAGTSAVGERRELLGGELRQNNGLPVLIPQNPQATTDQLRRPA